MTEEKKQEKSAVEKQRERTQRLYNLITGSEKVMNIGLDENIKRLCAKHSELIDDFEAVKEMNSVMSFRFDEVIDKFPLTQEMDVLIYKLENIYPDEEERLSRRLKLQSLRKIVVALEKHNENIRPKSYEESVETKEVND